jgi:nucleoid DNA-binding protein
MSARRKTPRPKTSRRKVPETYFKTLRKGYLVKMLREKHGMSKRKAAQAVNAVFALMTRALWRGENVDIPVGSIHAKSPPAWKKTRWQRLRNIQSGKVQFRIVHPSEREIVFTVDKRLILRGRDALPTPPPIPPETQRKDEELKRLFSQLMGREISPPDLQALLTAAADRGTQQIDADRPESHDRLIARLRQIVKDQTPCANLPRAVRDLYWIR